MSADQLVGAGVAVAIVQAVLAGASVPVVLDADALTLVAGDVSALVARSAPTILTPHAGELARLLATTAEEIGLDRIGAARCLDRAGETQWPDAAVRYERLSGAAILFGLLGINLRIRQSDHYRNCFCDTGHGGDRRAHYQQIIFEK